MSKPDIGYFGNADLVGMRDAFHVPCVLVQAADREDITAGCRVRFITEKMVSKSPENGEYDAIVDPFLESCPTPRQHAFWVFVKPDLVESFSHTYEIAGLTRVKNVSDDECSGCYS